MITVYGQMLNIISSIQAAGLIKRIVIIDERKMMVYADF